MSRSFQPCVCGAILQPGALLCRACWFNVSVKTRTALTNSYNDAVRAAPKGTAHRVKLLSHRPYVDAAIQAKREAREALPK